jgi:acyl-CoA thioesterase-1
MRLFALLSAVAVAGHAPADDKKPVRVACVGDSITAGSGYPKILQTLLGDGYEVKNFGVSGRTLLNKGDYPYAKEQKYRDALAYQPNVVVIKLGTNDTKPQNWKYAADFEADYKALVRSFRELESKPKIYLCIPVPAFTVGEAGITAAHVRDGVKPKVEALGKELGLTVIDLYAPLLGHPEYFPDKVHPKGEGPKVMAEAVAAAMKK